MAEEKYDQCDSVGVFVCGHGNDAFEPDLATISLAPLVLSQVQVGVNPSGGVSPISPGVLR